MQRPPESFDAIVVGSGISGGWAAKELTERGLRVLMIERGKNVEHVTDYANARKGPWEYPHRGGRTRAMEEAYPVLRRDYPLNEKNLDWWVNEKDSPYTEVKRFDWYRGYHVGGRSLTWGRQSYRLSDFDFEANAKEGIAIDWPIRYADLAPWYDHVERFAGIAGSVEGLPQLPDGQFQPAMPLNVRGEDDCRATRQAVRRAPPAHSRPRGQPHAGAAPPRTLPVPQRLLAWLSTRRLLQHAVVHAAGRGRDRPADVEDVPDRHRRGLRRREEARHRRAHDRCGHRRDDRLHREDRVPERLDAQHRVDPDALGPRRVAGRAWQQFGRAWSQPDGPPLPLRRQRHDRRARESQHVWPAADRLLHPALPQPVRRQARVPARLRLPGQRQPPGVAARGGGAWRRRRVQGRDGHAGAVADRRRRVRRDAAEPREQGHDRRDQDRQVGPAGAGDRLRHRRERAADARRHDERHGRDARGHRREERAGHRQHARSRAWASTRWARPAWAATRSRRC